MNLTQLKAFREVMRSLSISEASRQIGRTQPAVSQAIKSLEEELGITLFERRGRQMIPVPEAHYLMEEASIVLDRLNDVSLTMKGLLASEAGELNVAAMPGPSVHIFPDFISRVLGERTGIRVTLSSRTSEQIHELASTQRLDFGFGDQIPDAGRASRYRKDIIVADCFCAIPADHALAAQPTVSFEDIGDLPLGTLQSTHFIHRRTVDAFEQLGFAPKILLDSQYFLPILPFVSAGKCVSVVDPLTVVSEHKISLTGDSIVFRRLEPAFRYEYVVLTPVFRPLSQLAKLVKGEWVAEVLRLLEGIGANPTFTEAPPG